MPVRSDCPRHQHGSVSLRRTHPLQRFGRSASPRCTRRCRALIAHPCAPMSNAALAEADGRRGGALGHSGVDAIRLASPCMHGSVSVQDMAETPHLHSLTVQSGPMWSVFVPIISHSSRVHSCARCAGTRRRGDLHRFTRADAASISKVIVHWTHIHTCTCTHTPAHMRARMRACMAECTCTQTKKARYKDST